MGSDLSLVFVCWDFKGKKMDTLSTPHAEKGEIVQRGAIKEVTKKNKILI